ncbi:hypothetical protein V8E36_008362 [Tilletia maclaganii]
MVFLQPVHSAVQEFPWGKVGDQGLAAQLWERGGHAKAQGKTLDPKKRYGELWMGGTHEKGPSTLADEPGTPLSKVLRGPRKHEILGDKLLKKLPWVDTDTHGGVPVLFKVLSAGKALPLQAHPDSKLSRKLFKSQPGREDEEQVRYDGVHKPEIALALSKPFKGFIGFSPEEQITKRPALLPELQEILLARNIPIEVSKSLEHEEMIDPYHEIVTNGTTYSWHAKVGAALGRLLGAKKDKLSSIIKSIVKRAEAAKEGEWDGPEAEQLRALILELNEQYPGDSGVVVAPVFQNLAELQPGEMIYAPADTIHAWFSGDIIEAMPASVNVINAAFGPDPKPDTLELFTKMLSYEFKPLSDFIIQPEPVQGTPEGTTTIYRIPLEEFDIVRLQLDASKKEREGAKSVRLLTGGDGVGVLDGIAIVGVIRGQGRIRGFDASSSGGGDEASHDVSEGSILFVGKGTGLEIESTGSVATQLEVYIAVCQPKTR